MKADDFLAAARMPEDGTRRSCYALMQTPEARRQLFLRHIFRAPAWVGQRGRRIPALHIFHMR